MTKYQSKTVNISKPFKEVYSIISDLKSLEKLKDKIPQEYSADFDCNTDFVKFKIPQASNAILRIIERNKDNILFKMEGMPLQADMAINLKELETSKVEMQINIDADIPFFIKPIVEGKLKEGIDKATDMLANILNNNV